VRQGSVLLSGGGQASSVELTGPVLPHCVAGLARLFTHASDGDFTATFGGVHDPTLAFNGLPHSGDDVDSSPQSPVYDRLMPGDVCHVDRLGRQAVRELVCSGGLFTWTC